MAELRTPQGHTLLLPDGVVSIGADPANEVPVAAHLGLAPVHFRLQPWEGGHFIEDAGSGLGTLVNGHAINWKPLAHGDLIAAGELEVIYSESSPRQAGVESAIASPAAAAAAAPPPSPSLSGITAVSLLPLEASSHQLLPPTPPLVAQPPPWLPEDLLPENQHQSVTGAEHPPAGNPAALAGDTPKLIQEPTPHSVVAQPPRRFRRLLPLAAILAILGWASHAAWQSGSLDGLFQSLQSAWGHSSGQTPGPSPDGMPAPNPATPQPGGKAAPPPRPLTP